MSFAKVHMQSQSPLFALATELRLQIYAYALISCESIVDPLPKTDRLALGTASKERRRVGACLPATCRRIHAELDIRPLYECNEFVLTTPRQANVFFESLPEKHKSLITRITVDLVHCINPDGESDTDMELDWFEYLSCPRTHYRTRNNTPCSTQDCSHLFYDLPGVKHITLDASKALNQALWRSEVNRMLSFLLRGSCNGEMSISAHGSCRPDVEVTLVPDGAQKVDNCGTCKKDAAGQSWAPKWLCNGERAEECRQQYQQGVEEHMHSLTIA